MLAPIGLPVVAPGSPDRALPCISLEPTGIDLQAGIRVGWERCNVVVRYPLGDGNAHQFELLNTTTYATIAALLGTRYLLDTSMPLLAEPDSSNPAIKYVIGVTFPGLEVCGPGGPKLPGAPRNVLASIIDGDVRVTWAAPVSPGTEPIINYRIESRQIDGANEWVTAGTVGDVLEWLLPDAPDGVFEYRVFAITTVGEGPASEPSNQVIVGTAPSAPLDVTASVDLVDVTVVWDAPADPGSFPVTSYRIEGRQVSGENVWVELATVTDLFWSYDGAPDGTYDFRVYATNLAGEGPASVPSNEIIVDGAPPSDPSYFEGGIITDVDDAGTVYRTHTFLDDGTLSWVQGAEFSIDVDYLVVGGGGGSGAALASATSGGGGGGEVVIDSGLPLRANQTVTIGAGGAGGGTGTNGSPTIAGSKTAIGGGYGAAPYNVGGNGASGGGGCGSNTYYAGGTGTAGFNGGRGGNDGT